MKLIAKPRELSGKKVKSLRNEGLVPASVYGPKKPSTNIQFDKKDFIKLFKEVGFSHFFDLEVEGEKAARVLVKEIQKNPVSDILVSVSLYQVDAETKVNVEVPIEFIGEAPAVKQNLGFLITQMDRLEVHCLPKDLPESITVDVSGLENVGDAITVSDIKLPENVEFGSSIEESSAIVYIGAAQKEEVEEKPAEEAEVVEGAEGAPVAEGAVEGGDKAEKKE